MTSSPDYRFSEDKILQEILEYIDATYTSYYGQDQLQATEVIIDAGMGAGFCLGNIIKYAKRYGKKEGFNRKDLQKILHYGVMMLHVHDRENKNEH